MAGPSRLKVAFALAAVGHVAVLANQITIGDSLLGLATTFAATVGYAIAASGLVPWGIRVAALGAAVDLIVALRHPFTLTTMPSVVTPIGLLLAAWSTRSTGHDFGVRAGLGFAAFGTSLWVLIDPLHAVNAWLPGIVLTIVGLGLAASSFAAPAPMERAADAPS